MDSIKCSNISKTYSGSKVLDDINIKLEKGKIYGLIGRNGAGKSTLLRILAKRIRPSSGDIYYSGKKKLSSEEFGQIHLTEPDHLYPVGEKVSVLMKNLNDFYPDMDLEALKADLDDFGLDTKKRVRQLSTGYTSIFRAMVALNTHLPFIFLDEPTLGFDAVARKIFYKKVLEEYAESQNTILLSSHLIDELSPLLEEIIIIDHGRVLEMTNVEDLLSNYKRVTYPKNKALSFSQEVIQTEERPSFIEKIVKGNKADFANMEDVEVSDISLEDYFIARVGGSHGQD